ncbi:MAG: dienelactone hydrolase family protein [Candidatus Liptonbacteria bacterium]|nr:dienelactone hydrolase family protein [Candidatus Liptonbacteria bacterium]
MKKLDVAASSVSYTKGKKGYFAEPKGGGTYPGVVMIHEWWGLNDNMKEMARNLAGEGYRVLAVDLFGSVTTTADEARAQVAALDREAALANMKAAAAFLRSRGAEKIASLGWCFGGAQSLQLAISGEPLDATVIYYGQLVTNGAQLRNVAWPILGIFGEEDTSIATSTVRKFESELTRLGIRHSITVYPGVGHAFANPSGANYAPAETKDAWAKTLEFLAENLK